MTNAAWDIDLHIHTSYSDGQMNPEELVEQAAALGYRIIAITDHDGTEGLEAAAESGEAHGIRVIPGIEFAAETEDKIGVHILGFGMDWNAPEFAKEVKLLAQQRHERNVKLIGVLEEQGFDLTMEELQKQQPNGYIGRPIMARALAAKGYISKPKEAFYNGKFLDSPEAKAVKRIKIQAADAINLIREAGGIAVLAHPIQTKKIGTPGSEQFYQNIEEMIIALKAAGLSGLECYHPDQTAEQSRRFLEMAERLELYVSRGSDFHGSVFSGSDQTADPQPDFAHLKFITEAPEVL